MAPLRKESIAQIHPSSMGLQYTSITVDTTGQKWNFKTFRQIGKNNNSDIHWY